MKRNLFGFVLAAVFIFSSCQKTPDYLSGIMPNDDLSVTYETTDTQIIPGQYIVVFHEKPGAKPDMPSGYYEGISRARQAVMGVLNEHRIPAQKLGFVYAFALDGFSATLSADELSRLRNDKRVSYIEPDQVMSVNATQTQSNATWGIDRVDQRNRPLNTTYTYEATGAGVRAYIIDTGILFSHNEFGGRASFGFDAFGGNGTDGNGHGTHVAGTVGGATYGVAKSVSLIAVRVLDNSGSGSTTGVIAGMDWVAGNHDPSNPAVANMSLGGGASTAINDAVGRMYTAGVPVIVAAGNGNIAGRAQNACNYSPAGAPRAYTVGATTSTDAKASYSNYGDCVNIFAPGSSITSAWYTGNTAINTISGTSMASPHVAGAAALFLETNKTATAQQVYDALTNNSTKNIVTSSSTTNNHLLYTLGFGTGGGGEDPPPAENVAPTASFTYSATDLAVSFNASGSADSDGSIVSYSWTFGDGGTGSGVNASHTYAAAGTYTVTLTVTDDDGATGTKSLSVTVSVTPPPTGFTLSATGYKVKGRQAVDLSWGVSSALNVDVYRNGSKIVTTANDGSYTDNIGTVGGGSYSYYLVRGTETSNTVTVTF